MAHIFDLGPQPVVPIEGMGEFPVRRIFCVGRNYAAHAAEMGNEVDREAPFYFTKSAHSIVLSGGDVAYPGRTQDLHHEVELVVALGQDAQVIAYGCGIDMTRRDLQAQAKEKRRPWDVGKDFDQSAVLAPMKPAEALGSIEDKRIVLSVNDELRQEGVVSDMIWSVQELVSDLGTLYALEPGDLIMTGTPAGVGALQRGDRVTAQIDDLPPLDIRII
ncbi:fumarylacetoacetate hydrolase family protein [Palleronia sp. LCG004]|uniref:fumarylacetoacetate hydrolase family protein n=1 Tax=Palleronia sp. LCG004 TaxID=3079304 RepID=UPI0029439B84|nr:fumarylacetoacetate hydrolase family protein [Palleronia sp. LCG004]WOI57163.1 fumarylacetoacetate hydrolase family protein [Palleronia sp. LCG004]